jgi:flagellar biosynthesis protein FliR
MLDDLVLQQSGKFVLCLARVGTVLGFSLFQLFPAMPPASKAAFAVSIALLLSHSLTIDQPLSFATLLPEFVLGLSLGWISTLLADWAAMAAQFISLQAGFSYASAIDPSSQADSGLLPAMAKGAALLLFFALGFDQHLMVALVKSDQSFPVGAFADTPLSPRITAVLAEVFSLAVRLALPTIMLLVLVDLALAILGQIHQQLQLPNLTFPLKLMIWPLAVLFSLPAFPKLAEAAQARYFSFVELLLSR